MVLTFQIQKAINIASVFHQDQKRKADGLPYIVHPFSVAWILSEYTDNENVLCAGLLHDIFEETMGYGYEEMAADFGMEVAQIVKEVTEEKSPSLVAYEEKQTWEERKKKYLSSLEGAGDNTLLVSVADKIHNLQSLFAAYNEQGNAVWEHFNAPPEKKLWFYEQVYEVAKRKLHSPIVERLQKELMQIKNCIYS